VRLSDVEVLLDRNPRDKSALLVYADWLQQHGDPRGELIALQVAGDDASLEAAQKLFEEQEARLLPPNLVQLRGSDRLLELGFVRRLDLDASSLRNRGWAIRDGWKVLLEHHALRYVESLAIDFTYGRGDSTTRKIEIEQFVAAFAAARLPALHTLSLTSLGPAGEPVQLAPLVCPKLRELTLEGQGMFGFMKLPELESATLDLVPMRRFNRIAWHHLGKPMAKAGLPSLKRLAARWGLFESLVDAGFARKLDHVRVLDARGVDDICEALRDARLAGLVRALTLEGIDMTERGVNALVSARWAFADLEELSIRRAQLAADATARLETAFQPAHVLTL
jgi:uncharacterized protein (TIGR02996 family)